MTLLADAIERARAVNILDLARSLGAVLKPVAGRIEFAGPCVVCGGTDRFSVNTRKQIWNCRGCGKGGDVVALIQHVEGVSFTEAVTQLIGERPELKRRTHPPPEASDDEGAARKRRLALDIWNSSRSIRGTLAETYLARIRGVDLDQIPDLDGVLRFNPACPFGGSDQAPCLIALIRNVITDAPQAIQRTALDAEGRKLDRRGLGPKAGGAIKLWPDDAVTSGLVIGEGLETVAAATRIEHKSTLLQPAWSLIDRGNLGNFPVLPGIEALTILVDADASGDGQKAATQCRDRWLNAGRDVIRLTPKKSGSDFNDIARSEGTS